MNFMEIKKKRFFMSKKRKKINTVLEQFRFIYFFCAKNKDICTKKSVMKFWEIQENKIVQKKKLHKKNVIEFLGNFGKKFFFNAQKKNVMIFWEFQEKSFFFVKKKSRKKM